MKTVAGLDVHKDSVYLCILRENGEKIERVYGVLTPQLDSMRDFMAENKVSEVAMESTSVYWIPIWRVLVDSFELKLVNPYFIRQLPGRKSDVKDAQWIAECVIKELIRGSFIPPPLIQQLRLYDRRIFELNAELVRKYSKIDAILQRCNIRLSNYVSNTDCKSYLKLADSNEINRVGGKTLIIGVYLLLSCLPTSHTTIRAVRHTAVSCFYALRCVTSCFQTSLRDTSLLFYCRIPKCESLCLIIYSIFSI